jgi:hypothetical protein
MYNLTDLIQNHRHELDFDEKDYYEIMPFIRIAQRVKESGSLGSDGSLVVS